MCEDDRLENKRLLKVAYSQNQKEQPTDFKYKVLKSTMGFKNCEGLFKKRKCKITTGPTSSLFNLSSHKINNTMLPAQDTSTQKPATKSYKCQKDNFSITSGI